MASQEEAVVVAQEEEVKKVGDQFPVNGAPNTSFNSRISSVPGDMAESQVAVAGSVDSAAETRAEPDAAVDTGPAVDATEKVESWDLSEAVQEGATNKEDSKPNFSEDGAFEEQTSDSDLIASAEHVGEKAVEAEGAVTEELPAAAEDVNPKVQDDGSAEPEVDVEVAEHGDDVASPEPESTPSEEKSVVVEDKPVDVEDKSVDVEEDKAVNVAEDAAQDAGVVSEELPAEVASSEGASLNEGSADSGAPEPSVEEVHEVAEAAETAEEPTSVEAVADVEEKSDDVDDKPVDVEEAPVVVDEKPIVHEEKSVELNPEQTSEVVASSEEVSAPEFPVEENHEVSEATTGAEAQEAAASFEGDNEAPKPTVDEGHHLSEVTMTPLIDEEAASMESSPSSSAEVVEKSVEAEPEAVSEDADPKIQDEVEQGDSQPSVDEGHHLADVEITPLIDEAGASEEVAPSSSIDVEAEPEAAVSEDVNPKIQDEESADSETPKPTVDEGQHLSDVTVTPLIHEEEANVEASSANVVEKSVNAGVEAAGVDGEEAAAEQGDSEAREPTVDEGHHLSEVTMTPLIDEEATSMESSPSSSAEVVEKSVEAEPEAVSEDADPKIQDEVEQRDSQPSVDEGHHLADVEITPLIDEAGASEEAAPSPSIEGEDEAPKPTVDEGHHLSEVTMTPLIDEEATSMESSPSSSADVVEKSVEAEPEAVSEDADPKIQDEVEQRDSQPSVDEGHHLADVEITPLIDEAGASEEAAPSPSIEGEDEAPKPTVDEGHHLSEVTMTPLIDEEAASMESSPSSSADVVEKSVEAEPEAVSEDADPKIQDEVEQGDSQPSVDEGHHLADVEITPLIDEAGASEEAAPSPSIDVEAEPEAAVSEDVNPKIQDEESADSETPKPTVDEGQHLSDVTVTPLIHEEEANVEASSADVVEKSVDAGPEAAGAESEEAAAEQGDSEAREATVDEGHHLSDVTIAPLIDEEADAAPSSSDDVVERSFEAEPGTAGTGSEDLSQEYERAEQRQREPPKITVDVGHHLSDSTFTPLIGEEASQETVPAPADDVEDKPVLDVESASKDLPSDNEDTSSEPPVDGRVRSETLFVPDEDVHEVVEATITSESGDESLEPTSSENVKDKTIDEDATTGSKNEDVSSEPPSEATTSAGADASTPATDVEDRSFEINPEEIGEAKAESGDDEDVIPPFPTANVGREALYTPAEEVQEVVEATIAPEVEEESASAAPGELSVDKEVANRDLPSEAPETTSRDFSFNELKEALSTSSDVKAAPAVEEGSSSSDTTPLEVSSPPPAVEEGSSSSDTTPLEVSSPPPAVDEKEEAPKSYDLHEVVVELEDAAEKTLRDVESSIVGDRQASVAESVAHIVLEEHEKTNDSSELLSGVIQHVAQLAQDDFRADPNVLPDTVNQVFDREIASSPSNEASTQPKETTSLGTKFSLFIVWCISLCASHVPSKDMPAPALKLGAEEVAAVLQQNAQGAASSKAASSV